MSKILWRVTLTENPRVRERKGWKHVFVTLAVDQCQALGQVRENWPTWYGAADSVVAEPIDETTLKLSTTRV